MANNVYLYDGEIYEGAKAVAAASGRSTSTIYWHLKKHGHLNNLGKGHTQNNNGGRPNPVELWGHVWPSRAAFAEYLGVTSAQVRFRYNRMNERDEQWFKDRLIAGPLKGGKNVS